MRILGRSLIALLLLLLLLWVGKALREQPLSWWQQGGLPAVPESVATVSTVYLLEGEWLSFPLPAGSHLLKLLSNANLSLPAGAPGEQWSYALEYQVLGSDGAELSSGLYHHRSAPVFSHQHPPGKIRPAAYYPEGDLQPADGRILLLNLEGLANPALLRVRLAQGAPGVASVALRLYNLAQESDHKLGFLWQRLSQGQRQTLARGSVYPPELLSAAEKRNLVRQGWRPLGPQGVDGEDYFSRQLYLLAGETGEAFEQPVLPAGLLVSASNCGTLLLPPGGGRVRLEFLPALIERQPAPGAALGLTWHGPEPGERRSYPLAWETGGTGFSATLPAGLLEVSAPGAVVVRAYLVDAEAETEITSPPLYLRGYLSAPGQELLYPVDHAAGTATPLRLDLRTFVSGAEGELALPKQGQLEYSWLDAAGEVVRRGTLSLDALPSRYDRLADGGLDQLLAEPHSIYFDLPAAVNRLRLVASVPVLASAYTRPADLLREIRVPELELVPGADDQRQPAWFALRPLEHEPLQAAGRSQLLLLQRRPPTEERPEVLAGHYLWEDFHPQGAWRGRYLLTPREPQSPRRLEALAATYLPLPFSAEAQRTLVSPLGELSVSAELLWLRPTAEPASLGLMVDGALFWSGELVGARGQLSLPPLPTGRHRLRLEGQETGRYYLSHAEGGGPSHLKRLANRFDREGLNFVIEKNRGAEILSARLYVPSTYRGASRVRVTIEGPPRIASGPLREWSFLARRYELHPDPDTVVPVLQTTESVDGGRAFFIPLGADLPAGRYRLRAVLEQGPGGYLILARLTPGQQAQRFHFRESEWLRELADD